MPGPKKGQLTVDFIEDHYVHGVIFERESYGDFVRNSALEWLYKQRNRLEQENAELKERVARLQQMLFGTSSEQSSGDSPAEPPPQAAEGADHGAGDPKVVPLARKQAKGGGRKPLPADLPRERINYELPEHDRFCPCCHGAIQAIGEEITEQLTVIPAQYKVLQHARKKYVCRKCSKFVTAPGPRPLIEKSSYASADFLAHVAVSKYQFGLPFYRQEAIFEQQGLSFNRTTLANLMIGCSDKLAALHETLRTELLGQGVIHADETSLQVLKEPGRKPQSKSQLWLYRSGEGAEQPVVLFEYQMTRQGAHPRNFLNIGGKRPFTGYLQVDGYAGYNGMSGVTRVGCMAHVRRKFMAVVKALPSHVTGSHAHHAVELIGKLYNIERKIKGSPYRNRHKARQEESVPILDKFKTWLDDMHPKVTPGSGLGGAIRYAREQWDAVVRYVDDGRLSIDNNIAEREMKAVVIGRKNWLFADSMNGAHANAIMYSLVQTAKANGIDPFGYLKYVIETMPKLRTASDVQSLLPWNMPRPSLADERLAA